MKKKPYSIPTLTTVEFAAEHGYAASGSPNFLQLLVEPGGNSSSESFSQREGWTDDASNSFWD